MLNQKNRFFPRKLDFCDNLGFSNQKELLPKTTVGIILRSIVSVEEIVKPKPFDESSAVI